LGSVGDASVVPDLVRAARDAGADTDVAVNASGGLARIAARTKQVEGLCPLLAATAPWTRANALVGLGLAGGRCGDGASERQLLLSDRDEGVRIAAARVIAAGSGREADRMPASGDRLRQDGDRRALSECLLRERVPRVAALCRAEGPVVPDAKSGEATLVFVVHEGATAKPLTPYALLFSSGLVRVGVSDRRGAVFEAAPPGESITLAAPH
jgi:hypothetical protein